VEIATAYYSDAEEAPAVVNLLDVGGHQQVMIEIVVAEMSRTLGREMGTNFAAVIERNGEPIRILSLLNNLTALDDNQNTASTLLVSEAINLIGSFTAGSGMYTILMDVLRERGMGRVLAEPTVIARSGETARFLAGGEIPIPVAQGGAFGSITIEFKEFGVGVLFTPTVLADGRIHLQVSPEVSEPDFTLGVSFSGTSVPGFNTRRASTAVELGDGETFAVAGLLSDRMNHIAAKYPIMGELPVIGALFRSLEFQRNETELVILVTPRLVGPLGPHENLPALPTDSYVQPNDLEFYLLGWMQGSPSRLQKPDTGQAGLITPGGYRLDTTAPEDSP
jgi:pilus assembly protein CpaC